jgi:hypothetical protein
MPAVETDVRLDLPTTVELGDAEKPSILAVFASAEQSSSIPSLQCRLREQL